MPISMTNNKPLTEKLLSLYDKIITINISFSTVVNVSLIFL